MSFLRSMMQPPSAFQLATQSLESAKRELLVVQASAEHAALMVKYYQNLVARLTAYVEIEAAEKETQA